MDQADWNRHYAEREPPGSIDAHVRLADAIGELPPGRALDLACGTGRNAIWLALRGWVVTAVDFSDVAIASARRLAQSAHAPVSWVVADLLAYDPPERAFDLVTMLFLHLPAAERDAVIATAAAAVAPGGTLVVVAHDRRNLAEGYRGPRDPQVLYSAEDVAAGLHGFTILRAEAARRSIDTPEGPRAMVDAICVAGRPPAASR